MSASIPDWLAALQVGIPSIATLGAGVAGYWGARWNEEKRDERATNKQIAATASKRLQHIDDERRAFQRDVLLQLQDELVAKGRTTFLVLNHDRKTLRNQHTLTIVGEELSASAHETRLALQRSCARVLDDDLRRNLEEFLRLCTRLELLAIDLAELPTEVAINRIDSEQGNFGAVLTDLQGQLGDVLRGILNYR